MKKLTMLGMISLVLMMTSCASKKEKMSEEEEHGERNRDYKVIDYSHKVRPGWINDAELWANEYKKDTKAFRYFGFETEPKVGREIACNLAKANARADIASEIATFIDKQLGSSTEGNASIDQNNPQIQELRSFVENTLAEKIQALIHGASPIKTYWEKRRYMADLGAKKNFIGWSCAVLIRMPAKRLAKAVDEAANHVIKQVDDPETKENVKKALSNASENFVKAKTGQI